MKRPIDPDVRLLQALADPARLSIVRQLASERKVCQCDLTVCIELAQPTVSHHLRVLREAGLVLAERRGTWVYYSLDPAGLVSLEHLAAGLLPADLGQRPGATAGLGRRLPVVPAPGPLKRR